MALYTDGKLTAAQLECYRVASADDALDPFNLLRERALALPSADAPSPESLVRTLIDEIDAYLAKFESSGIAEVRHGIGKFRDRPYVTQEPTSNEIVNRHLQVALNQAVDSEPSLSALISASSPFLRWITYDSYDVAEVGASFAVSHAYCSIMGEQGAIGTADFDLGLFLIAPHVVYRDRRHAAPELYAPLTGPHGWRFKPEASLVIKPAHQPIWNDPYRPHFTKVGSVPFLCLYCWTRDNDKPAEVVPADDWLDLEQLQL